MSFDQYMARDRRLVILKALSQEHDRRLNDRILLRALDLAGHTVPRDVVLNDIVYLAEIGAVIRNVPEGVVIAEITERGEDHMAGRTILEGVNRPPARRGA